jgi:hypothetical protein
VEVVGREGGNTVISAALGKDVLGGKHSKRCSSKTLENFCMIKMGERKWERNFNV